MNKCKCKSNCLKCKKKSLYIVAVDFDKTLCGVVEDYPLIGKQKLVHKIVLAYVKYKQKNGATIIINTLREGGSLEFVLDFCKEHNFVPNLINENHPDLIAKWGESRKIACDLNIDDTNIGLIGWILRHWGK